MNAELSPGQNPHTPRQDLFSEDDKTALEAYLDFSGRRHDQIMNRLLRDLKEDTSTAIIFGEGGEDALLQQSRDSQALLRRSIAANDFSEYVRNLSQRGVAYAQAGWAFRDWIKLITFYRDHIHSYALEDHADDARQISLILQGISKLGDLGLEVISRSYFDEKTRERQREQAAKDEALRSLKQKEEELRSLSETLEQKVEERTAELKAINKELENFSYTVSHDLRAPLRAIGGYARVLTKKAKDQVSEEQMRYLNVIIENVAKMGALIDDLLLYSRTGRADLNTHSIDMTQLVRYVFDDITDPGEDGNLEFELTELPPAVGDREMMKRALANLLSNAVKFSRHKDQPRISVKAREEGREIIYLIEDNGAGFEMEYVHKLFGIFQRLHSEDEYEGTGVGLAIVQRIIHKHGGRVWAEGEPGQGARFYFSLPKIKHTKK